MLSSHLLEMLTGADHAVRPYITKLLPAWATTRYYSSTRNIWLKEFANMKLPKITMPANCSIKLWDIAFNCPLFNAAGMFKTAEGYNTVSQMGAGAFLVGTTTASPRRGNSRYNIRNPFLPYSRSKSASNWMGLPNKGHFATAKIVSKIQKQPGCPIGVSLAEDPSTIDKFAKIIELVEGMLAYERVGADFIEINFSCPNIQNNANQCEIPIGIKKYNGLDEGTVTKLAFLSERFLSKRTRNIPVIVKYSNDLVENDIPPLVDLLIDLQFDGINIGNTTVQYSNYLPTLHPADVQAFQRFIKMFGGGLSGSILKDNSLHKCQLASQHINKKTLKREFVVIRTGGIENKNDIIASQNADIKMNQWFTGFFDAIAKDGFEVMRKIFE